MLDLRAVPGTGPVRDWFAAPHLVRESGSVFTTEAESTRPETLPERYDAVIFVDTTTRARPIHAPW